MNGHSHDPILRWRNLTMVEKPCATNWDDPPRFGSVPFPSRPHKLQVHQEEDQCHQASATYHKSTLTRWWIDIATNAKTNGLGECRTNSRVRGAIVGWWPSFHAPVLRLRFRVKCSKNPPKKGTWIFSKRLVQGFLVLGTEDGFFSCAYRHPSRNSRSMHNNIGKRSGQTDSLHLN